MTKAELQEMLDYQNGRNTNLQAENHRLRDLISLHEKSMGLVTLALTAGRTANNYWRGS